MLTCNNFFLYDGLVLLRNLNGQQMDEKRKNIMKTFKYIGFDTDIQTNIKEIYLLTLHRTPKMTLIVDTKNLKIRFFTFTRR